MLGHGVEVYTDIPDRNIKQTACAQRKDGSKAFIEGDAVVAALE